jgi:hypothetical protein
MTTGFYFRISFLTEQLKVTSSIKLEEQTNLNLLVERLLFREEEVEEIRRSGNKENILREERKKEIKKIIVRDIDVSEIPAILKDNPEIIDHSKYIHLIEAQIEITLRRAYLIRRTIALILVAVACLYSSSLFIILSYYSYSLYYVAVGFIIGGLFLLFIAIIFAFLEMVIALDLEEQEQRVNCSKNCI